MSDLDPLRALWRDQPTKEIPPMTIQALEERSHRLVRKVALRKWAEVIAGGMSIAILGALGLRLSGAPVVRIACLFLVVGEAVVIASTWRRSAPVAEPVGAATRDFLAHYRAELTRERDRLRSIAGWYLAPVAPGIVLLAVGVLVALGAWTPVVAGITLGSTALTYAIIVLLNRRAARTIDREIEALT